MRRAVSASEHQLVVAGASSCPAATPANVSRAVKDAGQRVVVGRRNRIELVVVAAGAGDRHAQHARPVDVDLIVDHVHAELFGLRWCSPPWDRSPESRWRSSSRLSCSAALFAGSRSPAICSTMNRSYGLSALNASMT